MSRILKAALESHLSDLKKVSVGDRLKARYQKYRLYGKFIEKLPAQTASENAESTTNGVGKPSSNGSRKSAAA
jgi:hypothetical protein